MSKSDFQKRYGQLFPSDKEKAIAFDKIAERYYFGNFGKMQKSDFETLLFSLYLDRILESSESDMQSYSDYTLSKTLGITQGKVGNLKVKKELEYPSEQFDWKESFLRIVSKARYENGKIRINIPDKNLYLEIKNAIEESGGYIDVQLNSSLLQISPEYFIDLIVATGDEKNRDAVRKNVKEHLRGKIDDAAFLEKKSIGELLQDNASAIGMTVLAELIEDIVPVAGKYISTLLKNSVAGAK